MNNLLSPHFISLMRKQRQQLTMLMVVVSSYQKGERGKRKTMQATQGLEFREVSLAIG